MRLIPFLIALVVPAIAQARIGETALQFVDRYGPPKDSQGTRNTDKSSPLVDGAIHHTYEYQGWKIRAAFLQLDGPAVRMTFQKLPAAGSSPTIQDYELQAIAAANTPHGTSWSRIELSNPKVSKLNVPGRLFLNAVSNATGEKMWQRSDGATLWLQSMSMVVQMEIPAAREHEQQLKTAKDQKARASVPQF